MLPTKGYFQDIECPYYDNSCGRPYCHFRHRKKQLDLVDEGSSEENTAKEVPTYKPTPKSELAVSRSHIPISYVPDIIYRAEKSSRTAAAPKTTFLRKPTYEPTPISLLTSAVKSSSENEGNRTISEIKQSMANTKYSPKAENISQFEYKPTALEDEKINENLEKHEYKPIGESSNNFQYNPTALEDISEHNSSDVAYKPTSDNIPSLDYKPSPFLVENSNIDFENLDSEFDMIDEIINMSDKAKNPDTEHAVEAMSKNCSEIQPEIVKDKKAESIKDDDSSSKSLKHSSKSKSSSSKRSDEDNKKTNRTKVDEKNHKDHKTKNEERNDKDNKSKHDNRDNKSKHDEKDSKDNKRHESKHKTNSSKTSSREASEKCKIDSKSSIRKSETKEKERKHSDKGHKEKHKSREKERSKVKDRSKDENKTKDKHKISSSSSDTAVLKSKDKDKDTKSRESEHNKQGKKHKSEKEKERKYDKKETSKEKDKSSKHDERKHKSHNNKSKSSNREKDEKITEEQNEGKSKFSLDDFESGDDSLPNIDNDVDIDFELDDDDETMRECFRIFSEYTPTEVPPQHSELFEVDNKLAPSSDETTDEVIPIKKRVAHSSAPSTSAKFQLPKPNIIPTPGQIMNNRFKIIKAMQANNEEKLIIEEVNRVTKRPAVATTSLIAEKKPKLHKPTISTKPPTSLVDDIISGNKTKPIAKKIAPVSNVMNIQRAKAQLEQLNKRRAAEQLTKTVAQTNKIGKRQAHVPEYSLDDIPDVIDVDKSKLPVNVRTRFLTMLADECCKLYLSQADAYKRALDEEYTCYQKCKVLVTYRNSAMLAVNRIRKELQEREQKNMGLLGSSESSSKSRETLEITTLYTQIEKYILTEEELDIHGYPRESRIPGTATIKNRRVAPSITLPKNQKKCCRCSKIYLVDDKERVIYEEECVYHPLRKRTIRGEQIYLCCKSNDDSGCATSHTHVSEMSGDAELIGFQTTMPPDSDNDPRSTAIFALDCEMCYTTKGLELTRVTIVDTNCKTVYESLVKPLNEIIDYNTRFSGITKQQMDRINTGILQVQANILHLCNSKTILIGHSLESDMKALKIVHSTIVDTSVLFPHKMGLPYKRALRTLASDYLKKIIQNEVTGHDSAEDAITCMELVKWKVKEDSKFKSSK